MTNSTENLYQLDGRVPLGKAVPFGLQHVLAMFVSNIAPIMILASAIGLDKSVSAVLVQNCMVIAGIGTLVQLYPVWRIGSRLPIVMGISFTFLSLAISIGAAYGMGTLIGAVIVGGVLEGLLGLFAKYWIKLIPHVVAATVVTAIGFSLLPVGANSFAGGQGRSRLRQHGQLDCGQRDAVGLSALPGVCQGIPAVAVGTHGPHRGLYPRPFHGYD